MEAIRTGATMAVMEGMAVEVVGFDSRARAARPSSLSSAPGGSIYRSGQELAPAMASGEDKPDEASSLRPQPHFL